MKRVIISMCLLVSIFFLAACGKKDNTQPQVIPSANNGNQEQAVQKAPTVVEEGHTVEVMYIGALENGDVFDTNIIEEAKKAGVYNELRPYDALSFNVGSRNMIPGFEKGVVGMKIGETKTINITAADGYGAVRDEMFKSVPVSELETAGVDWQSRVVGEQYTFDNRLQGVIVEKTDTEVKIDFNHFLAGKDLVFTVTIKNIIQ